jgi:hypothetical protein
LNTFSYTEEFLRSGNEVVELAITDDEEEMAKNKGNENGKTNKKNGRQQKQFHDKMRQMCA